MIRLRPPVRIAAGGRTPKGQRHLSQKAVGTSSGTHATIGAHKAHIPAATEGRTMPRSLASIMLCLEGRNAVPRGSQCLTIMAIGANLFSVSLLGLLHYRTIHGG